MSGRSSRYPFTASQWQELEHQALIFKYMASGTPIPHDLLLPIRRSFYLDSTPSPTQLFPHQPSSKLSNRAVTVSSSFPPVAMMGFGRKPEDPEPGRCRRTDGKKWRCSKEAYPDSKYCERHMHRGKNRSRKPVEISIATNSTAAAAASIASSAIPPNPSSLIPPQLSVGGGAAEAHHLVYPFSASRHPGVGAPLQGSAHHFHIDAASSTERDYRYCHGMKEDVDQYAFFSEASGGEREGQWRFTPLGMSSLGETRQRSFPFHQQGGGYFGELAKEEEREQEEKRQHCFVLGADFKLERPAKEEREGEAQRPLRHLFDDWPMKAKEPWMGSEEEEQPGWGGFPMTQLSISIPMAHHDFPAAAAGSHSRGGNPSYDHHHTDAPPPPHLLLTYVHM
ncbi:hypothetical protein Taro_046172 [Colocasia esculenta]|uniref:Growth-regulating factor n=1 Tax=Colocasia esculenta TaxID=4460 RepID=A0A843WRJ0_COLES|nr:hypothetical protein [Colocasia esculenta]